jgi:hypothetical protein
MINGLQVAAPTREEAEAKAAKLTAGLESTTPRKREQERLAQEAQVLTGLRRDIDELRAYAAQLGEGLQDTSFQNPLQDRITALEERLARVEGSDPTGIAVAVGAAVQAANDGRQFVRETVDGWQEQATSITELVTGLTGSVDTVKADLTSFREDEARQHKLTRDASRSWFQGELRNALQQIPAPVGIESIEQPTSSMLRFRLTDGQTLDATLPPGPEGPRGPRGLSGQASVALIGGAGGGGQLPTTLAAAKPAVIGQTEQFNVGQVGGSSAYMIEISTPAGERWFATVWAALANAGGANWTIAAEVQTAGFPQGVSVDVNCGRTGIGGAEVLVSATLIGPALPAGSELKVAAVATVK